MVVALPLLFMCLVHLLDDAEALVWMWLPSRALLLNATPGLLLAFCLTLVTGRLFASFLISACVYGLLYKLNWLKVTILGTPLLPQDLGMLSPSSIILLRKYVVLPWWSWLAGAALILLLLAMFRLEPVVLARKRLLKTVAIVLLIGGGQQWWGALTPEPDRLASSGLVHEVWSPRQTVASSGLVNAFAMFAHMRSGATETVDEDVAGTVKLIELMAPPDLDVGSSPRMRPIHEMPDIVVVQSESLFDPAQINGLGGSSFKSELMRFADGVASGAMHVPTYGGATVRSEFEALTGVSLRALPSTMYPYMEVDLAHTLSIANVLGDAGYVTYAIHPNAPDFWRRGEAFRSLGFQTSIWDSGFSTTLEHDGPYISDASLYREMSEILLRHTDRPLFLFSITIQNHGPYPWHFSPEDPQLQAIHVPDGLSDVAAHQLRTYLYHVQKGEAGLRWLVERLADRRRPTLLFVYGDHLPALPEVFAELGMASGRHHAAEPALWFCISFKGDWCPEQGRPLATWRIPGLLQEASGVSGDTFFALKNVLPDALSELTSAPEARRVLPQSHPYEALDRLSLGVDVARVSGHYPDRLERAIEGRELDRPPYVMPPVLGRFVDTSFAVTGLTSQFEVSERAFAYVDFIGYGQAADMLLVVRDSLGRDIRQVPLGLTSVRGRARRNLDLGDLDIAPGDYHVEVRAGGRVVASTDMKVIPAVR